MGRQQGVDLVVGAGRVVVEEDEGAGAGRLGQADGVLHRRVPEVADVRELGRRVLGVVDEDVDPVGRARALGW